MTADAPVPQKKNPLRQRKLALISLSVLFLVLGILYLGYWYTVLRHHVETDDAYVAGNQVQIMSQVSGNVVRVLRDNTDWVKAGDPLIELDPTDAQQTYARAETALANSVRQTHQLMITSKQLEANIRLNQTALDKARNDLQRREVLGATNAIAREELQHAREAVQSAQAALEVATQQYKANQAMILDTPLANQPAVQQAAIQLREAWLAQQRTVIRSPITGYVSRRAVQVGAQITPNTPLMAVVPADQIWIDANFKETQLARVRIGQPVDVISDFYGDGVVFKGRVVGLDMGTGSAFSLLPAQNASGNWIKVVQRLPVRIALEAQQLQEHPLRIGLSTLVTIDTSDQSGQVLSTTHRTLPAYESTVLQLDLTPVNQEIERIIRANAG